MKAYISSTFIDLRAYRESAFEQLRRMGVEPVGMEYFAASTAVPVEECLAAVDRADLFVLILGFRYGYVPEGYEQSITQLEYERAVQRGIPIFGFVLSDDVPVSAPAIERDPVLMSKLAAFKSELYRRHVVALVRSPEDFSANLTSSLVQLVQADKPKEPESAIERRLAECREEAGKYRQVIGDLSAKLQRIVPADPIWRGRNFQIDELLCFVVLPFRDPFFEIYEAAIAPAAQALGLRPMHASKIFGNREVVEDIWDSICKAGIVVADVTGRNPNVF